MVFQIFQKIKCNFNRPAFAYLSMIGGFLVQLTLGSLHTYGNMAPYMLAYMKNHTEPLNNINVGNSVWIFGLLVFGLGASMSLGGFIEPKLGTWVTILLGSWMMSSGIIVTYWTINIHLALVAISYGLIVGVGVGIAYGVILRVPSEWFPQSKGLVTGIIVAGFGLGPVVFDFLQAYYINDDVRTVNLKDVSKVPMSFILVGFIYAVLQLVGSLMIRRPQPEQFIEFQEENMTSFTSTLNDSRRDLNLKPHQLLFERDFWILWITYAMNSVVYVMVSSLHKVFGKTLYISDINLTAISAVGSLFNGAGRILWGYLNDRIPYKVLMSILCLCSSLMVGTFYMCALVGETMDIDNKNRIIMYSVWVIILNFLVSGNFSLFPTICVKTFGTVNFAGNYGLLFTGYSFAGLVTGTVTTKLLTSEETPNSYLTPFLVSSGLSLLSSGITLFYRGRSLMYSKDYI